MLRLALCLLLAWGCAGPHGRARPDAVLRSARARLGQPAADDGELLGAVLRGRLPLEPHGPLDAGWLHALAGSERRLGARPAPGALVFFAQGQRPFHAAVVEQAEGQRLRFLHVDRGQVRRGHCDLAHPARRRDRRGHLDNSYLVPPRPDELPGTRHLCGELVLDYARF